MLAKFVIEQNPHWDGTTTAPGTPRKALDKVKSYLDLPHVISLVGVRRAGKSTIAKQLIDFLITTKKVPAKNILFVNLEHPALNELRHDVNNLEKIFEDYRKLADPKGKIYCILDEVHFFSAWEVFVKAHYEKKNVKFIVTSSNSHLLSTEFLTLLSGRTLPVEVFPFSFSEFIVAKGMKPVDTMHLLKNTAQYRRLMDEYIQFGGFPETLFIDDKLIKKELLIAYAKNILYQDIAARFKIKKTTELERLFYYFTSNIGSLFSFNNLTKLIKLDDKTIKQYISFFSEACLLFTVDEFSYSVKNQINSQKKIYTIDTGIANSTAFAFSENLGHQLENLVFLHAKRNNNEIFYYKTKNNLEVDFVLCDVHKPSALIQVAKEIHGLKTRERELRSLIQAMDETKLKQGLIITYEDEEIIEQDNKIIKVVPIYKYLLELN